MDIFAYLGNDLEPSATGDLLTADSVTRSKQRVLRRLLTNPGDYIWHPEYGAGLPSRIGTLLDIEEITGLIRSQIFEEASVQKEPEPVITVTPIPNGVSVGIRYVEAESGQESNLQFSVTP